jgi:hypothetical protein
MSLLLHLIFSINETISSEREAYKMETGWNITPELRQQQQE